jgi:transposase InsO family protein
MLGEHRAVDWIASLSSLSAGLRPPIARSCACPEIAIGARARTTRSPLRSGVGPPALTINGLYKAEVILRRGPWRSFEAVEFATLNWVDWFNNRRLLEPIGAVRGSKTPLFSPDMFSSSFQPLRQTFSARLPVNSCVC